MGVEVICDDSEDSIDTVEEYAVLDDVKFETECGIRLDDSNVVLVKPVSSCAELVTTVRLFPVVSTTDDVLIAGALHVVMMIELVDTLPIAGFTDEMVILYAATWSACEDDATVMSEA